MAVKTGLFLLSALLLVNISYCERGFPLKQLRSGKRPFNEEEEANNNNEATLAVRRRPNGGYGFYAGNGGNQGPVEYPEPTQNNNNNNYPPPIGAPSGVVAFTAERATQNSLYSPSVLTFERTVTNLGPGFEEREGVFVCRYPGLYVFGWSAVAPKHSQFRVSLVKNGREIGHSWGDTEGYHSGGNMVTLYLNTNDRVMLRLTEGKLYEPDNSNRGYTTFTGFKLN